MHELNVKVESGVKTLEIRKGEALELKQPVIVKIIGAGINAPLLWLQSRVEQIEQKKAHILVDKARGSIALFEDENNYFGTIINGELKISPTFKNFGINSGNYKTPLEMSEFIKMNRAYFENRQVAMELVTQLRKFRAKVDKQVEQEVNLNKGDKRLMLAQAVESNVPETFKVCMPIFKGMEKTTFEVETYFNPDDLTCTLVSPDASETIENIKESAIDSIINEIKECCPEIVIINE